MFKEKDFEQAVERICERAKYREKNETYHKIDYIEIICPALHHVAFRVNSEELSENFSTKLKIFDDFNPKTPDLETICQDYDIYQVHYQYDSDLMINNRKYFQNSGSFLIWYKIHFKKEF